MGLFTRRSKADMAMDYVVGAVGPGVLKGGLKVVAGAAALAGLTAASAAISNARSQG